MLREFVRSSEAIGRGSANRTVFSTDISYFSGKVMHSCRCLTSTTVAVRNSTQLNGFLASYGVHPAFNQSVFMFEQVCNTIWILLFRSDVQECIRELPKYFRTLMSSFTSGKPDIQNAAFQCFREILIQCIDKTAVQQTVASVTSGAARHDITPLEKVVSPYLFYNLLSRSILYLKE